MTVTCPDCKREFKSVKALAGHKGGEANRKVWAELRQKAASQKPTITRVLDSSSPSADRPATQPATAPASPPVEETVEVETHEEFASSLPPLPSFSESRTGPDTGQAKEEKVEKEKATSSMQQSIRMLLTTVQGRYNDSINISFGHAGPPTIEDLRKQMEWTDNDSESLSAAVAPIAEKYMPWLLEHYTEIGLAIALIVFVTPKVFAFIQLRRMLGQNGGGFSQGRGQPPGGGDVHNQYWADFAKGVGR